MAKISKRVEKEIKKIIYKFLNPKEYKVFIFGSRLTGRAKKFSDYDVGILSKKPVPFEVLALIDEAFEESDLPYKVDVVDFSRATSDFKKIALAKIKKL